MPYRIVYLVSGGIRKCSIAYEEVKILDTIPLSLNPSFISFASYYRRNDVLRLNIASITHFCVPMRYVNFEYITIQLNYLQK